MESPTPKRRKIMKRLMETPSGLKSPALHIPATPHLKQLGFGTGVSVFLYERSPMAGKIRSPWALKKINRSNKSSEVEKRLAAEAEVLRSLSHPHIIGYRAFKKTASGTMCLVMEDGQKALYDMIEERDHQYPQSPYEAVKIGIVVRSVADALNYLHTEKLLMHGDIKSANILITGDFLNVKLCDFGVTLTVNKDGVVDQPFVHYVGTEAWSPKEVLDELAITTKCDIFAFGLVIFEMLALHPPHIDKISVNNSAEDSSLEYDDNEDDEYDQNGSLFEDHQTHLGAQGVSSQNQQGQAEVLEQIQMQAQDQTHQLLQAPGPGQGGQAQVLQPPLHSSVQSQNLGQTEEQALQQYQGPEPGLQEQAHVYQLPQQPMMQFQNLEQPDQLLSQVQNQADGQLIEDDDDESDKSYDDSSFREALGTRPFLPDHLEDLDDSYRTVLEVFFAATEEEPEKRPSAAQILMIMNSENQNRDKEFPGAV